MQDIFSTQCLVYINVLKNTLDIEMQTTYGTDNISISLYPIQGWGKIRICICIFI